MQGKKQYQEKLFVNFQLSDRVPADNFYRRLKEVVDFNFLRDSTAKYYGKEGQKSIDPVVFMKLMLVGYLENLNSDRRIINSCQLRLDVLYFLNYNIDEQLPWHSTLSRTRKLYGKEVFSQVFKSVLKQCIDKGMIAGRRQAVDGFFIKANASMDNIVEQEVLTDADIYSNELEENEEDNNEAVITNTEKDAADKGTPKSPKSTGKKLRYNPSDPDARMSVKSGKAMALNYLGEISVDTASHIITHAQAFTAEKNDSPHLPEVVKNVVENLKEHELTVEEVIADTGFSSGEAIKALEERGIIGYIPNRALFVYERPGFIYHEEGDFYSCPGDKKLTYRGTYNDGDYTNKHYRANRKDCNACPLKDTCTVYKKTRSLIKETVDRPYYVIMHHRMQSEQAKGLMKIRQSTVEPVIGTLVNYLGIKRVNCKGLVQADKCLTIAATAYNLKKLLKLIFWRVKTWQGVSNWLSGVVKPPYHFINVMLENTRLAAMPLQAQPGSGKQPNLTF